MTARSIVAVGTFDGVHLGHQALLAQMRAHAGQRDAQVAIVTFDPPPRTVLHPDPEYRLLTSLEERVDLLRRFGADEVVVSRFDAELASQTADQFCGGLVEQLGMVELVGGPDMAFGRRRHGTPDVLREIGRTLGFEVSPLDQLAFGGQPVRSGAIRDALRAGDVPHANELLGHPATVAGPVVHGDHRGRTIGVPTANLDPPPIRLIPGDGVYAVHARLADGIHPAVMNVGIRPTVGALKRMTEVHLLDWQGNLYGQELAVELVARLRDERKFGSLGELVAQIRRDIEEARAILNS